MKRQAIRWAEHEFGRAELGDERRTRRLVMMAARAAANPAGKVTTVFRGTAAREGAFRLLENDSVPPKEIARAAHATTVERCRGRSSVCVPIDQSSLSITDEEGEKGLGLVGARLKRSPGLCVMSAIAVGQEGTPIGLCGQAYWARTQRAKRKKNDPRPVEEKETQRWLDVMAQVRESFGTSSTRPWFVADRGADCWPVIVEGLRAGDWLTVRAAYDRRLEAMADGKQDYLWPYVASNEPIGSYLLKIPSRPGRQARSAVMQLQACAVTLDLLDPRTDKHFAAPMWAVRAVEVDTTPADEDRVEWLLLTTRPVATAEDAQEVLLCYATRWRIEEFHRVWKTGACNVEDTQLRERDHIERWVTILASVAMRILRLTYLARHSASEPATVELTKAEIDAIIMLKEPKGIRRGHVPTIGEAVSWIADLGGYTGKSSGGPPGAIVISRGLHHVEPLAIVLARGKM